MLNSHSYKDSVEEFQKLKTCSYKVSLKELPEVDSHKLA